MNFRKNVIDKEMEGKAKRHMERAHALSSGLSLGFGGDKRKFVDLTGTIMRIKINYRPSLAVKREIEKPPRHLDDQC